MIRILLNFVSEQQVKINYPFFEYIWCFYTSYPLFYKRWSGIFNWFI